VLNTASEGISFYKKLEDQSLKFYEELAYNEKYAEGKETFLAFAKENKKHKAIVVMAYQYVITDAIETGFGFQGLDENEFPVNVNIASYCNAYYDYESINFFRAGGGCPNTAFSTVIHHEYGHHLVAMAGSGQGQYGEGMGDVMGVLITDDPGLAYGFYGDCDAPLRNASNDIQYPCYI